MDLIWKIKAMNLINQYLNGETDRICAYEYTPQKQRSSVGLMAPPFPRATPESQGLHSDRLAAFFRALETADRIHPHGVVILRHGMLVADGYWAPYRPEYPHMMYSLSKSVTGTAVGIAVSEGRFSLDDKLTDLFPGFLPSVSSLRHEPVRVRHLLTMTSGAGFNEVGSMMDPDWVRAFMESDIAFRPGTRFQYNSLNSYMLAAIIRKTAGMSLADYLRPRLFQPMGISRFSWETCPRGTEKGGWGLSLTAADMAKLGQLYLQKGVWRVGNRLARLVPAEWIEEATRPHIRAESGDGKDGYGYQIWMCPQGAYQFNGAFGQIVVVIPKYDTVVSVISGSECAFLTGSPADVIARYFYNEDFYSDGPLPENHKAQKALWELLGGLRVFRPSRPAEKKPFWSGLLSRTAPPEPPAPALPAAAARANGVSFSMEPNHGGILPLIQQMAHANYSRQVSAFRLDFEPDLCRVTLTEGENRNTLAAGLDGRPRYAEVTVNGETYRTGTTAEWAKDAAGRDELQIFVSFVETPCTRILRVSFDQTGIFVTFGESPAFFRTVHMFGALVGGDDEEQRRQNDRKLSRENLFSRAAPYAQPVAFGPFPPVS